MAETYLRPPETFVAFRAAWAAGSTCTRRAELSARPRRSLEALRPHEALNTAVAFGTHDARLPAQSLGPGVSLCAHKAYISIGPSVSLRPHWPLVAREALAARRALWPWQAAGFERLSVDNNRQVLIQELFRVANGRPRLACVHLNRRLQVAERIHQPLRIHAVWVHEVHLHRGRDLPRRKPRSSRRASASTHATR